VQVIRSSGDGRPFKEQEPASIRRRPLAQPATERRSTHAGRLAFFVNAQSPCVVSLIASCPGASRYTVTRCPFGPCPSSGRRRAVAGGRSCVGGGVCYPFSAPSTLLSRCTMHDLISADFCDRVNCCRRLNDRRNRAANAFLSVRYRMKLAEQRTQRPATRAGRQRELPYIRL
jgi:hypothetical protein